MSGGAGPSKKPKTYHFHPEWEEDFFPEWEEYFFPEWEEDFFPTMSYSKCVFLICQSTIAIPKKGNVERHFRTVHRNYDTDFPPVHQHILYI